MANANLIGAGAGPVVQVSFGDFETGHSYVPVAATTNLTYSNEVSLPGWEVYNADGSQIVTDDNGPEEEFVNEWLEEQKILHGIKFAKTELLPYLRRLENFAELLDMLAKGCNTLSNRVRRHKRNDQADFLAHNRDNYNQMQNTVRFEIVRVVKEIDSLDPRILEFDMYDAKREVAALVTNNLISLEYHERKCYMTAYSRFLEDLAKGNIE